MVLLSSFCRLPLNFQLLVACGQKASELLYKESCGEHQRIEGHKWPERTNDVCLIDETRIYTLYEGVKQGRLSKLAEALPELKEGPKRGRDRQKRRYPSCYATVIRKWMSNDSPMGGARVKG